MPRVNRLPSGGGAGGVLAGQHAAGDRVVGDDADAVLRAERQQLPLDLAEQQVVAGLHGVEAGQPEGLAAADGPRHLIGQEVRAAGVADLALAHQVVQRAQGLVDRRVRVVAVQLVQVDVVGLQPAQRRVDGGHDVLAGVAAVHGAGPVGAKHLVATMKRSRLPCSQRPRMSSVTPRVLGPRRAGRRRRCRGSRCRPRPPGRGWRPPCSVALQPERHRPQAQPGDLQAGPAQSDVIHNGTVPSRVVPSGRAGSLARPGEEAVVPPIHSSFQAWSNCWSLQRGW